MGKNRPLAFSAAPPPPVTICFTCPGVREKARPLATIKGATTVAVPLGVPGSAKLASVRLSGPGEGRQWRRNERVESRITHKQG